MAFNQTTETIVAAEAIRFLFEMFSLDGDNIESWIDELQEKYPDLAEAVKLLPQQCEGCGINYADLPSRLCPGCQAYREHQQ